MTAKQQLSFERSVNALASGYENSNIPTDFSIPSCGIADVDKALFDLFDKQIGFQITQKNKTEPVPVIFSGAERFANVRPIKKNKPIRDKNGTIVLPIIAIRRTNITQSEEGYDGVGTPRDTGDLVIKRRLSSKDPRWQQIVNKSLLQNQDNVATQAHFNEMSAPQGSKPGTIATRRNAYASSKQHPNGELLSNDIGNNIYEIITIPFPQFFVAEYEITLWAQYQQHMNQMLEKLMTSYYVQGNNFRIESDKGYWFVAFFLDDIRSDDNISDFSENERILRYTFSVRVPGYMIAPDNSGDMSPFRRIISAPQLTFEFCEGDIFNVPEVPNAGGDINKFILSDIQELDKFGNPVLSRAAKVDYGKRFVYDPFTANSTEKLGFIVSRNKRTGESVISSLISRKLDETIL